MRSETDFVQVGAFDDEGAEARVSTLTRRDISPGQDVVVDLSTSALVHNGGRILVGHNCGAIDVFDLDRPGRDRVSATYSDRPDNHIKRSVLTDNYFGAVYSLEDRSTVGYCLFSTLDGSRLAGSSSSDIQVYGRSHVSATPTVFVFSYSDALHNQHFLVHDLSDKLARPQAGQVIVRSFTLYDR